MDTVFGMVKKVVALLAIAFVVALCIGIYMAMDSFGKEGISPVVQTAVASEGLSADPVEASLMNPVEDTDAVNEGVDVVAGSDNDPAITQNSSLQPTSTLSNSSSSNLPSPAANSNSSGSATPPAPSALGIPTDPNAGKVWHEPWDEWVSEGHYEDRFVEAIYGQREVYGSKCNECGLNISGFALQHLKDTHHSGYHDGVIGSESYIIKPATTEQVWVDTSHNLHHDGYWQ